MTNDMMNLHHDAVAVQICLNAGLSVAQTDALISRISGQTAAPIAYLTVPNDYEAEPELRVCIGWMSLKPGWYPLYLQGRTPQPAAQPSAPPEPRQVKRESAAARDILAERRRQIEAEGWTPEHDDAYASGVLAEAAASYALGAFERPDHPPESWPWDQAWWKPSEDPRRNLVKACALLLAEIERIDRADAKGKDHA